MRDVLTESGSGEATHVAHPGAAATIRRTSMRRPVGLYLVVGALGYCAYNSLDQGVSLGWEAIHRVSTAPVSVIAFQFAVALTSTVSVVGAWRRTPWATRAIVMWGLVAATFVALLQPLLDLPKDALPGLLAAAVCVFVIAGVFVWCVQRDQRTAENESSAAIAPVHNRQERM